jgi:prephenate dehydrogenase
MIVVMEETATETQVSQVLEKIIELGFDIYRTTGARYTILGAVGAREITPADVETLEVLDGVKDVVRISGPSVKKLKRLRVETTEVNPEIHFDHLTIFGVGLIGGSFALAARKAGLANRITGCGDKKFLQAAIDYQVIDEVDESFENQKLSNADFIYLAAPVGAIIEFLREKGQFIKPGAMVMDAGSAKREICLAAQEFLPAGVKFVGGHPMAGSHKVGVEFANAELFKNAPYAIIVDDTDEPVDSVNSDAIDKAVKVIELIGGRPVRTTAERHDEIVARISHAPQLISVALALATQKSQGQGAFDLAGKGFSDMTRLAHSSWSVWEDIIEANTDNIASALSEVIIELQAIRDYVTNRDRSQLQNTFQAANDFLLEAP